MTLFCILTLITLAVQIWCCISDMKYHCIPVYTYVYVCMCVVHHIVLYSNVCGSREHNHLWHLVNNRSQYSPSKQSSGRQVEAVYIASRSNPRLVSFPDPTARYIRYTSSGRSGNESVWLASPSFRGWRGWPSRPGRTLTRAIFTALPPRMRRRSRKAYIEERTFFPLSMRKDVVLAKR